MSHGLTVPIINPSTLSCSTSDNESVSVKKKDNIHGVVYSTNFENTLEGIEKYLVAPTAILSGASSVLSFVQTNILHSQSKATDLISIFLNKAALFSAAIFGGLQTAKNKDSFGTVGYVAELTSIGTLAAFTFVSFAVLILRATKPNLKAKFRCPWMPYTAIVGIIINLLLMFGLPTATWVRFVGWMIIGLIVYFTYGFWFSKLRKN